MVVDILIRSYRKDFDWLGYCLASIAKYCRGFRSVVVVVPRSSAEFLPRVKHLDTARVELCDDYQDDYLGQQLTKLTADRYSTADFICHVDSDCVFERPTSPNDFIEDGRPRILMCPRGLLGRHDPWGASTERFIAQHVSYDFMRHPPFIYPRWLYGRLREHAIRQHGSSLESYVLTQPARGFSEYNALGAVAFAHYPEFFGWLDTSLCEPPPSHCRWYWSWGGIDPALRRELDTIIA